MEAYIAISFLNDFIFCPRSIYFHQLYANFNTSLFYQRPQLDGLAAHGTIDEKSYSTSKHILQGYEIFCEQYNLCGKIDLFDINSGKLTERKREIKVIYDGYVFQVYAHCFALREMGYEVKSIVIHDLIHNKNYPIALPENDEVMFAKFEKLVSDINSFNLECSEFIPHLAKCERCIYNQLCDKSLVK
jgi:CRISPR-associated exonuclease Cas4